MYFWHMNQDNNRREINTLPSFRSWRTKTNMFIMNMKVNTRFLSLCNKETVLVIAFIVLYLEKKTLFMIFQSKSFNLICDQQKN